MNKYYNNKQELEQDISNYIQTNNVDYNLESNGDIIDTSNAEYDFDNDLFIYSDCDVVGNINTDEYFQINGREFIFDANYLSNLEYAKLFVSKFTDVIDSYIHEALTGTCYVEFTYNDMDFKIRFADHSDCYANSTYNVATTDDNTDGITFESLINTINNLLQLVK
jgi:hypothetical protein